MQSYRSWLMPLLLLSSAASGAVDTERSVYTALSADTTVTAPQQTLLSAQFTLTQPGAVLVSSDGNLWAGSTETLAGLSVYIDGAKVSNDSVVHWPAGSGLQHAYNAIGMTQLAPGTHTATLVGAALNGQPFSVGGHSNLAVFINPSAGARSASLPADTLIADTSQTPPGFIDTSGWDVAAPSPLPALQPLSVSIPASTSPVVVLSSARGYSTTSLGDPLLGIGLNGADPGLHRASWSVNDIGPQAEIQAPFFNHAYFPSLDAGADLSLRATVFPWGNAGFGVDSIIYTLGAGSRLIALYGGMQVAGATTLSNDVHNPWTAIDVLVGNYRRTVLTEADITIPQGHPGVVFFSAKTRVQEQRPTGTGGWAAIRVVIQDQAGRTVGAGSIGAQNIVPSNSIGQRTLTASYLAAGTRALAPGQYKARVEIDVWTSAGTALFTNLQFRADLPLLWFD